jgi:hypothetical protein
VCYSLLSGKYSDLSPIQEYRPVGIGHRGVLDVWVPCMRLGIMIDGDQHFNGQRSHQQAITDAAFDEAVMAAAGSGDVMGLLRLHHADSAGCVYDLFLAKALALCRDAQVAHFILYTRSYSQSSVVVLRDGRTLYGVVDAPVP